MNDPTYFLGGIIKDKESMQDFEGPLSLILSLLTKDKIEIRDIVISDILEQYLEYINKMQKMDLEIASEFVQMAAYLIYIKTKTLLSTEKEVSELELLMQSLEQLKSKDTLVQIKQILPEFQNRSEYGQKYITKQQEIIKKKNVVYDYKHKPVELLKSMYSIYSRGTVTTDLSEFSKAAPNEIPYGVKDKSRELMTILKKEKHIKLENIYNKCKSRSEVVATFISVLELCSMGNIEINRNDTDNSYEINFIGGDIDQIIDRIIE